VFAHDDGIIGIGVDVRTAEIADFAKNAKTTADFADIAKISEGELRQVEQVAEIEPHVILRHGLVLRAHPKIPIADKRAKSIASATLLTTHVPPATRRPMPWSVLQLRRVRTDLPATSAACFKVRPSAA
jgi:hypothetical protein